MKTDLYTKAILTTIAVMLAVIACKPLAGPDTTVSAQSATFAGVQGVGGLSGLSFFDTRTGEIFIYSEGTVHPDGSLTGAGSLSEKFRLTKLGQPLAVEYIRK